ncbi:MAG: hypothetical protein P9X24_05480 [Candidatus Hatepunaea meridiana]|nr:hypothetical protein [Candidatus Hatepunaea meridiana]
MKILNTNSLSQTLDNLNEAFFNNREVTDSEKTAIAKWLAERQGVVRSYAGMPAPTEEDYQGGIRLFTGEKVTSGAATGHILGEEACRVLILLDIDDDGVQGALKRATDGMLKMLNDYDRPSGMYCCGTCTPAYWRHLVVGGLDNAEERLSSGMKALKAHRDNEGKWRRFPFWWTLLALREIDLPGAKEEIQYTIPRVEKSLKYIRRKDKYGERRKLLAERILVV